MTPEEAYFHAKDVVKGRWLDGEEKIAQDARLSYYYAKDIIKGRWYEGEKVIAQNDQYSCWYAINVLKARFPFGEPAIMRGNFFYYRMYMNFLKIKGKLVMGHEQMIEHNEEVFEVLKVYKGHYFTAFWVLFPNCPRGSKIMVFSNDVAPQEPYTRIKPHFGEEGSPVARYEPTENGWHWAVMFANQEGF